MLLERDGAVATIALNRPDRGNSLTEAAKDLLVQHVREVAADETVRAVVLTGSGRAFCAGQDLAEHAERLERQAAFTTVRDHYNPIVLALTTMPKPVIAAINGSCAGAGLGLALACDLRIAVEGAKFVTSFTAVGLSCDSGLSASLVRAVGAARASELVLLSEPFTAEQAAEWGVVSRVVPASEFADATTKLAAKLAAGPTLAYAEAKRALAEASGMPLVGALEAEAEAQNRLGATEDHRVAVKAFLNRQTPTYTGR